MWKPCRSFLHLSKAFNLYLVMRSHLLPREKHGNLRKEIDELGPFHIITQDNFASSIVDNTNRKHEMLGQELQASDARIGRAAQSIDDFEWLLDITGTMQWQQEGAEYVKILEYVNNKKFVRIIKELQGLVVSRLMKLDKMNLAGSGTR
jgi:hypothetical protein